MKILIVTQYFWPEDFYINDVAYSLTRKGIKVDVLTGKPNYPTGKIFDGYSFMGVKKEIWKNIPIYRIPLLPRGQKSKCRLVLNYCSFVFFGLLIAPWILRNKHYDVVFVYAPSPIFQAIPASFLAYIKNIPVVLWVQDLWPQSLHATGYVKSKWLLKFIEKIVHFTYSPIDLLLVQSKAFIDPVSKLAPHVSIDYYPNSVKKEFYIPQVINVPELESLQSGFTIMFAGNLGSAQAVDTIINAAEILNNYSEIKIVILGDGSEKEWLIQQISSRHIKNIYLEGRFPIEQMPILMRRASVLLVTLKNQPIFELTIPSKIQAYLAVGKPIIACLNGEGARLIEKAKAGLSVPAEDSESLANAILKMYSMTDDERKQMGRNGRFYFKKHFDGEMLISKLVKYFKVLIDKRNVH